MDCMCGIIGYKGEENAKEKIAEGLKKLEYRGYDSAGAAILANPSIKVEKAEGSVENLSHNFNGKAGIGHTRWATHGGVNKANAHPHTDTEGKIAVAHNGIIENHSELREKLGEEKFESETDTEVIPHLLKKKLSEKKLEKALKETLSELKGSYAVTGLIESGEMIAFRKDSPLVIGVKENSFFVASDVMPFLEDTNKAIFLKDEDYAVIRDGELKIFNSGKQVNRQIEEIDWDAGQACKNGFEHFMKKEIHEQPETVKRAVFQDRSDIEEASKMIKDAKKVYLTGCGTASYAAMLGAKYLRSQGIEAYAEQSHEFEYMASHIDKDDLVIAVSQSGETADLLSALKKTDCPVLSVTNVVGSTLARNSDKTLYINAGPEIGVASTKAFTAQLTVLKLLSYAVAGEISKGRSSLLETAEKLEEVIKTNERELEKISDYLLEKDQCFFIGRNKGRELASEAALKLKELSYIHAEAFPGGEFKHGTLSLIEEGVPVFVFMLDDETNSLSNAVEAYSRGAELIGCGLTRQDVFKYFIQVPEDDNREILEIVPFQILAYETSLKKGNNPDKPRNLAKSVTVK